MGEAFSWVGDLVRWFAQFKPCRELVDSTEGWIKWVGGKKIITGGPGIVWFWPLMTKFKKMPVVRDSINCNAQCLTLPSGETVLIEAVVIYAITDLQKLAGETTEPNATIADLTMGAVLYAMESYDSWEAIRLSSVRQPRQRDSEFNRGMRDEVQRALAPYGVNVLSVYLVNKAKCRVLKLVNSQEGG